MLYFTQLIYIKDGQEEVFHQFEDYVLPLIEKYKGQLMLRIRPSADAFIEHHIDKPYEVHLVKFDTEQDFLNYQRDETRKQVIHLKEQSVESAVLIQGKQL